MELGSLASWVSAGIAAAAAGGSFAGFLRARSAKAEARSAQAEATEQARLAITAAEKTAGYLERIAILQTEKAKREEETFTTAEVTPFSVERIPGYTTMCYLQNDTDTAKYGITITGENFDTEPTRVGFIGPNRHVEFEVLTDVKRELWVGVTWHRRQDLTDVVRGQRIPIF